MSSVSFPDLRILSMSKIFPHEEHDSQRSEPLLKRLSEAEFLTNPPLVAPMNTQDFVIMDGANRHHCFRELGYEHLLVQVAPYESENVKLGVWQHVISGWSQSEFTAELENLPEIRLKRGWDYKAVAQILMRDGAVLAIHGANDSIQARNTTLRRIVAIYQTHAKLDRTALHDPTQIWPLYPEAIALAIFPLYKPEDIIAAAQHRAFVPPGISRHMVQGRALKVNYPLTLLREKNSLEAKNAHLQKWIQQKMSQRQIRFYAESSYQFDE